jgi:DNA-binding MarR family transcriptional regulator
MHTVFFGLKRAHHGVLRIVRNALAQLGLTAARFDLLYAVLEREGLPQFELCQALGVSAATVSRMVSSLEKLGLIARHTTVLNRRLRHVSLTAEGRRVIEDAIDRFVTWGTAQLAVDSALCPRRWMDRGSCSRAGWRLEKTLDTIRHAYGDIADLYRPWEPDADGSPIWDAVSLEAG